MKVAVFGGTGFVGSYLLEALLEQGHLPVVMVRPGSDEKVYRGDLCEKVSGAIEDPEAVRRVVRGADAAIYNIGILSESPRRDITFEGLHFEGARLAIDSALEAGVSRFLLMSANGVKPDGTPYQKTKYMAEQYLQASALDWSIFRPSVVFGDPRGRTEFATRLYQDIVSSPLPAPLFYSGFLPSGAGSTEMSPVHARDLAEIFAKSLQRPESVGKIYCVGGPERVSWKRILQIIGEATGKRVLGVPTPAWAVRTVAGFFEGLDILPVTSDQIRMLMEGNTCDSAASFREFGIQPLPFEAAHLGYLINRPMQSGRRGDSAPVSAMSGNR